MNALQPLPKSAHEGKRLGRILTTTGGVGLPLLFLLATSREWAPPGTATYRTYASYNRLVALPALVLLVGLVLLWLQRRRYPTRGRLFTFKQGLTAVAGLGSLSTFLGVVAEFWWFNSAAYGHPGKAAAWYTFLAGAGLLAVSGVISLTLWVLTRRSTTA